MGDDTGRCGGNTRCNCGTGGCDCKVTTWLAVKNTNATLVHFAHRAAVVSITALVTVTLRPGRCTVDPGPMSHGTCLPSSRRGTRVRSSSTGSSASSCRRFLCGRLIPLHRSENRLHEHSE